MIKLLPNTSEQTITIVPRTFPTVGSDFTNVQLVITEDGTGISETITNLVASVANANSNYVTIPITFSILKDESAYYIEFTKDGDNWFRSKAYATSQTNQAINHTLNTNEYTQHTVSEDYIVLD